jgi:hypothetical protein
VVPSVVALCLGGGGRAARPPSMRWNLYVSIPGYFRTECWYLYWYGCIRSMRCNVQFRYQMSICSRTEEIHWKTWSSCSIAGSSGCVGLPASSPAFKCSKPNCSPYCALGLFKRLQRFLTRFNALDGKRTSGFIAYPVASYVFLRCCQFSRSLYRLRFSAGPAQGMIYGLDPPGDPQQGRLNNSSEFSPFREDVTVHHYDDQVVNAV